MMRSCDHASVQAIRLIKSGLPSVLLSLVFAAAGCSKKDPCSCAVLDEALPGKVPSENRTLEALGAGKLVVLDDCDDEVRRRACEKSAVERILREGVPTLHAQAARAAAAREWRDLAPAIEALLDDGLEARQAARHALAALAPDRLEAHRKVIAAEANPDARARLAVEASVDKDREMIPTIITWLAKEDDPLRADALARALVDLDAREAVWAAIAGGADGPGLVKVLDYKRIKEAVAAESPMVRLAAINALVAQGLSDDDIKFLVRVLEDKDPAVRGRAAEVLSSKDYVKGVEEALRRYHRKQ